MAVKHEIKSQLAKLLATEDLDRGAQASARLLASTFTVVS